MTGTARAQLRPLHSDDADAVLEGFRSDPVGMARQGDVSDAASARAYVDRMLESEATDAVAVVDPGTDRLIGLVTVVRDEENRSGWFSYWLNSAWRGDAIMARAAATVADAELAEGGLERLELGHRANNPTSGSVARAAGFLHEGTQRGHFLIDGRRQDVHLYGRLSSDPQPAEKVRPLPWASDERPWSGR